MKIREDCTCCEVLESSSEDIKLSRRPCVLCKQLLLANGYRRVVWYSSDNVLCTEELFE